MLFKHSSVLYAMFIVLIPIIIHLFKLRKFQKTAFTNVAFLEKIKIQSRKSSRLKKWLILFSRIGILGFLVIAFASPYLPATSKHTLPEKYIIYLDNSFSMQAKGTNGTLLKRAIQDIIGSFNEDSSFTLFTNDEVFKDIKLSDSQNEILNIDYCSLQMTPEQIVLKAKSLAKNTSNSALVVISDFQKRSTYNYTALEKATSHIIQLTPQQIHNTSIDSLWLTTKSNQKILNISTSSSNKDEKTSLSVFNKDLLIGKATIDFSSKLKQITKIPLPKNKTIVGKVHIDTNEGLTYDDTRFFSINELPKTKVLVIGTAFSQFLQKIYSADEFDFSTSTTDSFISTEISDANTIIINEIESFPKNLEQLLINFTKQGGTLCVIPSSKSVSELHRFLLNNYNIELGSYNKKSKKITQISFSNPLYENVFYKKSINFQYPTVKESYSLTNKDWALNLEDNSSFLIQHNSVFVFSSPLNEEVTNFKNSPLVVPTFYNIAKKNISSSSISYIIGNTNSYTINAFGGQDNVLTLKSDKEEFIPLQQVFRNYIRVSTDELPKRAGNYSVLFKNGNTHQLSYNYNSEESLLVYVKLTKKYKNSVVKHFQSAKANFETTDLWKWFLIFALFFVIIEILLIKFLK